MKQLEKFSDVAYALLRAVAGAMFFFHGLQKIVGIFSDHPQPALGSQIWIGGLIELVGGFLVMVGFQTRWAAFICSGEMAVAYVQFHWKLQTGAAFFPAVNKGETALLYSFVFLYVACKGAGKWGLDRK